MSLLLVDGHNLLWRAAFGFPARITSRDSRDITAEFGFFALLRVGQRELSEAECIVCFDGQYGPAKRQSLNPDYKATRIEADMSPIKALPAIKAGLESVGVLWIEFEDKEADDLIASLCAQSSPREAFIMSTDKDFSQLLDERVFILNTSRKQGHRIFRRDDLLQRHAVTPEQWCDFRALMGDPADNISGVPGIGKKTAARLLDGGKNLEELDQGRKAEGRAGLNLRERWSQVLRDRDLMRLKSDIKLASHLTGAATAELPTAAKVLEGISLWGQPWDDPGGASGT